MLSKVHNDEGEKMIVEIQGINNTMIVEKTRVFGEITEYEARHQCVGDVWHTLTKTFLEEKVPLSCGLCQKDIVIFKEENIQEDDKK